MIARINRGDDAGGLMTYLADTVNLNSNHQNLHENPTLVTGSLGYTGPLTAEMVEAAVADLRTPTLMNPDSRPYDGKNIWHASLSANKREGRLSNDKWAKVSEDFMSSMKMVSPERANVAWVAVNHGLNSGGQDHIHIAANLIREDGSKVGFWRDKKRASAVLRELEPRHGLHVEPGRHTGTGSAGYSKNDGGRAKKHGTEPRRIELERRVRVAAALANSEQEFQANLTKDGLKFKPYKQDGHTKGYSVNLPKTTTNSGVEHWWAGGKLAKDLSLPRLQQYWEHPTTTASQATAVSALTTMRITAPTAAPDALADMSHQLSGALAVASQATEQVPGELAGMSRKVGSYAQRKGYRNTHKPPALNAGMLLLLASDPTGKVGQAVMIRQLLAASRAVIDAHKARVPASTPREGSPLVDSPEDELLETGITATATAGAMVIERHARNKTKRTGWEAEPWTADSIAKFRIQDEVAKGLERFQPPPAAATLQQREDLQRLGGKLDIAVGSVADAMNSDEAARMIRTMEYADKLEKPVVKSDVPKGYQTPDDFLNDLERKAAAATAKPETERNLAMPTTPKQRNGNAAESEAGTVLTVNQIREQHEKAQKAGVAAAVNMAPDAKLTPSVKVTSTSKQNGSLRYTRRG